MSKDSDAWQLAYDGSVQPEIRQFRFEDLQAGSVYRFKVWSRNERGISDQASSELEVIAATYPPKMDPPSKVSATIDGLQSAITL